MAKCFFLLHRTRKVNRKPKMQHHSRWKMSRLKFHFLFERNPPYFLNTCWRERHVQDALQRTDHVLNRLPPPPILITKDSHINLSLSASCLHLHTLGAWVVAHNYITLDGNCCPLYHLCSMQHNSIFNCYWALMSIVPHYLSIL